MNCNNLFDDGFILDDRFISEELKQKIKEEQQNEFIERNKYFFELYYGPLEVSSYWQNSLNFAKEIDFYNINETQNDNKDINYQSDNCDTSSDESDSDSEFENL